MKEKIDSAKVWPVANEILKMLKPFCERIEIAGSLRRGKAQVSDIEVLYVPKFENRQLDMFTTEPFNLAEDQIGKALRDGVFKKRPNEKGFFAWGAKNKLGIHVPSGIPVDLFATENENWFVSLVIRTGSKETNLKLTMGANDLGCTLNAYGCGVTRRDGTVFPANSEQEVFALCGVKYLEPKDR